MPRPRGDPRGILSRAAAVRLLLKLDALHARSLVAVIARDPVAIMGVAIIFVFLEVLVLRCSGVAMAAGPRGAAAFAGGTAIAAALAFGRGWAHSRRALVEGPFAALGLRRGVVMPWLFAREALAVTFLTGPVLVYSAIFAPAQGVFLAIWVALGAAGAAVFCTLAVTLSGRRRARRARPSKTGARRPQQRPLAAAPRPYARGALALGVTWPLWRGRSFGQSRLLSAGTIYVATTGAAFIMRQFSDGASSVIAIIALGGVLTGLPLVSGDYRLLRLLGRQPLSLAWLVAAFAAPGCVVSAALTLLAGLLAQATWWQAWATAAAVGTGLGLWGALLILHGLGKSRIVAPIAAAVDFACAAGASAVFAPLGPFILIARGAVLVRAAAVRRWSEA